MIRLSLLSRVLGLLLFSVLVGQAALSQQSQSIDLTQIGQPEFRCVGSGGQLAFTHSGNFAANNTFIVQLATSNSNTFTNLPGTFAGSPALFTLPASVTGGGDYRLRIASTNPVQYSFAISFRAVVLPTADLQPVNPFPAEPINPYTSGQLQMRLSGGGAYTVVLTDSTRFVIRVPLEGEVQRVVVRPARSVEYRVASVRNACGYGTPGNTLVPAIVNPVAMRFINPVGVLCAGSTVAAQYTTSAPLPAGVAFQAELIYTNRGNRRVAVPVSGTASPLQLTLPSQLDEDGGVLLRVFDSSKNLSVYYTSSGLSTVRPVPVTARLNQERVSVPFGGVATLSVSLTATLAGEVVLSNGRRYAINRGFNTFPFTVQPTQTTAYSIVSATGTCNAPPQIGNRSTLVEVTPGFRIDSLSTYEACAGTPVTLYYSTSLGYTMPNNLYMLTDGSDPSDLVLTRPGQATFAFPETSQGSIGSKFYFYNKTTRNYLTEMPMPFVLKAKPTVRFFPTSATLGSPQPWTSQVYWSGGGETTVEFASGERVMLTGYQVAPLPNYTYLPALYMTKSTTYSIVAASNECGRQLQSSKLDVTLLPSPAPVENRIYLTTEGRTSQSGCPGRTTWVNLATTGTFAANNTFRVELSNAQGQFTSPTVLTLANGLNSFSIAMPQQVGGYRLRVVSSNPQLVSNELGAEVWNTANVPLQGEVQLLPSDGSLGPYAQSMTVVAGEPVRVLYNATGAFGGVAFELADGQYRRAEQSVTVEYIPTTPTTYRINRLTDGCGRSVQPTQSVRVEVVPQRITRPAFVNLACANRSVGISFATVGDLPAGGTYLLRATAAGQPTRELFTTGSASPLTVVLPADMVGKSWQFWVVYRTATVEVVSEPMSGPFEVMGVPNVRLSGTQGEESLSLRDGSSVTLLLRDEQQRLYTQAFLTTGEEAYFDKQTTLNVSQPGTYSLAFASNDCGYGTVTGSVRVVRGLSLRLTMRRAGFCVGEPVSFTYTLDGDTGTGSRFDWAAVNAQTGASFPLGSFSTATGAISYSAALPVAIYNLQVVVSGPSTTTISVQNVLRVQTPVSVSLVPAGEAIYANDPVGIPLVTRAVGGLPCSITLSNGQVETLSFDGEVLTVRPFESGSFSVVAAQNGCGTSAVSGVVSVTVLPLLGVALNWGDLSGRFCPGSVITPQVWATGTFAPSNSFTLLMGNALGQNLIPIGTATSVDRLTATIPATTTAGTYLFRIASSAPAQIGPSYGPVAVNALPVAVLNGTVTIVKGDSARLSVSLTGTPPWLFTLSDSTTPRSVTATQSPVVLTVRPQTTTTYQITEIRNAQCGFGPASNTALVTVSPLLATEPTLPLELRTWPNPTTGWLQIEGDVPDRGDVLFRLHTVSGTLVQMSIGVVRQGQLQHRIDLSKQPAGVYILTVEQDGRRSQFKVLKQ